MVAVEKSGRDQPRPQKQEESIFLGVKASKRNAAGGEGESIGTRLEEGMNLRRDMPRQVAQYGQE